MRCVCENCQCVFDSYDADHDFCMECIGDWEMDYEYEDILEDEEWGLEEED